MTGPATAVAWLWTGMVLAISFVEAPLKFRVVDIPTGLGIGRVVFRALNSIEAVLAVVLLAALLAGDPGRTALTGGVAAVVALVVQLVAVRPALGRRSDAVLSGLSGQSGASGPDGPDGPSSHAHLWYVGLELVKVAGLIVAGVALL